MRINFSLFAAVAAFALAGCAHGPIFREAEDPPPDRARIFFYRPGALTGAAGNYGIKRVESKLGVLRNGSYFPYFAEPGTHTFYNEGISGYTKVTVEVLAGETYFIRGRLKGFLGSSFKLELVHPMIGRSEIMDCRLSR